MVEEWPSVLMAILWVGTGDRHRGVCPQDNSLVCGVVLRIDANGKGAS